MRCTLKEPFRSMRFMMMLAAAVVCTFGYAAYWNAEYEFTFGFTKKHLAWAVISYLAIQSFLVILWILVFLHFIDGTPSVRSKQLFSGLGVAFNFIVGLRGLTVIYGDVAPGVRWTGRATTPTYIFCCLGVGILLALEIYFGYREDGCQCEGMSARIQDD